MKRGVTQDKHLKLSESTEFKLKTWNSCSGNKSWVTTSLGVSRKPLDTGLDTGIDTGVDTGVDTAKNGKDTAKERQLNNSLEKNVSKLEHIDVVDYTSRLKLLKSKSLKERRGDTNRVCVFY